MRMIQNSAGDPGKAKYLFTEYSSLMYDVAYGILHHQQNAEDAVQDAFLKILQNVPLFEQKPAGEVRALIIVITRNTALNLRRKLRHTVCSYDDDMLQDESMTVSNEAAERVQSAFVLLSEEEQQLLHMKYWEELTHSEIAASLGISESAAVSRVRRARSHLKEILLQEGDAHE